MFIAQLPQIPSLQLRLKVSVGSNFILNANQCIKHHRSSLIKIKSIGLHTGLRGGLIRIPSVDMKSLDARLGAGAGSLTVLVFDGGVGFTLEARASLDPT